VSPGIGGRGGRGHTGRLMTMDGVRRSDRPGEGGDFVREGVKAEWDDWPVDDEVTGD